MVGITAESHRRPGFLQLLHSLIRAAAPSFRYTSLTLLSQVKSLPHRDIGNVPGTSSLLLPLVMPPSGGHLWVEDLCGNLEYELPTGYSCWGRHVPLSPLQPVWIDPAKYHATQDWEDGQRLVVVAYHLRAIKTAGATLQSSLRQLGFPLPESPSGDPANHGACQGGGGERNSSASNSSAVESSSAAQPKLAAIRLPQSSSSSSAANTGSDGTQPSSSATQSQFQSNTQPSSSSVSSSGHTSVQPPASEHLEEMTLEELLGSLTPCSQHYLHSRARAYSRGLRFVGEDRVNRVLNEVVRRNELPRILLSGEELEEEAARVVPRPTGYPPPYNAERASASSAAPLFGHEEASGERGIDTLPMPLPSQGQTSSMEDVSSGGRPSQFVPETWSDFDTQGAYLQAENDPEDERYVADPAEEPDEFEDEPIGSFAGPHPYQWTEVTERVALLWLQDPPGTASELRTVQPDLFWREDDPLLYHIVTEHPDPPPHRVYEQGQLVTVIRHWVRGGLHHTLCVLDIPEVNPWLLAEETRYVVLRSRYSPGGDFVHLLPVAARAAAVRVPERVSDLPEISGQGEIVEGAPSSVGAVAGLSEGSGGGQEAAEVPSNGEDVYPSPGFRGSPRPAGRRGLSYRFLHHNREGRRPTKVTFATPRLLQGMGWVSWKK